MLCRACAQASSTQETCFLHLLIISSLSCVFPLPRITMATSCKVSLRAGKKRRGICRISLQQMRTFDHIKAVSLFPVNGEPLISLNRKNNNRKTEKLTDNLPTSRRRPHLTTYQLLVMQTLCGERRAAGERGRRQLGFYAHCYNTPHLPAATLSLPSRLM